MIKFEEIASGIWVYRREDKSNCGVIAGDESVAVIDPRDEGPEYSALSGFVADLGRSVAAVVLTHGNTEMLPPAGRWEGAERIVPPAVSEAEIVGAEPVLSLPLAGWEVTILQRHTRLGVYNEERQALFCGDMLSDEEIPVVPQGGQGYLDSLAAVEGLDAKLVIPAVGAIARGKREVRSRIERDRNYLYALYRHVNTAKAANIPLERALQAAASVYEVYPFVNLHVENVRYIWNETDS